ncbi:P-loop containing nucleoside triphosphate hydrolase protein [Rhizoctonia solani]|nr:P-loop containing nucleoside triphosphate hydrolase protein [Rhizoctonia solani]
MKYASVIDGWPSSDIVASCLQRMSAYLAIIPRAQPRRLLRATTNMDTSDNENLSARAAILIVLCGLVGSGKSGFSTALQRELPEFRRCNQDELGKRQDVEREVNSALSQGLSVCVDRVNFDTSQRRTWIDIARQYPGVEVWCLEMDTPYKTCHARVLTRKDHPTLKTPEQAVKVLRIFRSQYVPPDVSEGFNRIYRIQPQNNPDYTREDIENVLAATWESPYFPSPDSLLPVMAFGNNRGRGDWGRGYSPRGHRARGTPNFHSWRFHHPSPTGALSAQGVPVQRDGDNWRTRDATAMNTHGGRGGGRGRVRGGYRGRGRLGNNSNEHNNGN